MAYYNYAKERKKLNIPPFFVPDPIEKSVFDKFHENCIPLVMKPLPSTSTGNNNTQDVSSNSKK